MINATVLVYDSGFFVPFAKSLVGQFKKVYYFCPWESGYSRYIDKLIGTGIEGVEKVDNFWDVKDKVDLFVFTDYIYGDLQGELKRQGKLVWGFGKTNWLEADRWRLREWQKNNGLLIPRTEEVKGIDKLQERLKEGQYIKISNHRADMETAKKFKGKSSEQFFDELAVNLGVGKNEIPFIIEDKVEGIEPGYDTYTVDGKTPDKVMLGYEVKDEAYFARWISKERLPLPFAKINDKLAQLFVKDNVRAFYSTEIKMPDKNKGYLLDFTARMGNPPYQLFCSMIENLGEILYYGAQGKLIQPKLKGVWGAIAIINSDFAAHNSLRLTLDKKIEPFVYIMNMCVVDEQICTVPKYGLSEIGAVVGYGDTLEQAISECKKHAEGISGYQLEIDTAALDKAKDTIVEGRTYGVMI